jgi:hypothetical protein
MADFSRIVTVVLVVLVLAGFSFVAGCAKNRGQDTGRIPSPVLTTAAEKTVLPVATPVVKVTTSVQGGALKTCTRLGGTVSSAGQTCPGTYLAASDTFSCCSAKPAGGSSPAAALTIEPFTAPVENEDLGGISG